LYGGDKYREPINSQPHRRNEATEQSVRSSGARNQTALRTSSGRCCKGFDHSLTFFSPALIPIQTEIIMKVAPGLTYVFHANLIDLIDGRTGLKTGDVVRVVNLPGAPKANTRGHAHVESLEGEFIGLVHINSLHTKAAYIAILKDMIAKAQPKPAYIR
jgi:hypothetical protein